ncbi:MAG TPA: phosphatase PAP2 family protein [Cystobacter sp.]
MKTWTLERRVLPDAPEVRFKPVDVVIIVACAFAAFLLVGPYKWAPGAATSAVTFFIFALGPLVLRTLESYFPRQRLLSFVASFWLLPVVALGHGAMCPLVTAVTPGLQDAQLATLDQRLFGAQVSVVLGQLSPPWLTEFLLFCYYGYFLWPLVLGVTLYFAGKREAFDEYLLALSLFFAFNFVLYSLVPAIGPRYFLYGAFPETLQGVWFTPYLESAMRQPGFAKDCFPSGHTGATLVVLVYALRFERRVFRVMLLPGLGLIAATLVGRFHYATDLMCAVPLLLGVVGFAMAYTRSLARRGTVERPVGMDAIVRS